MNCEGCGEPLSGPDMFNLRPICTVCELKADAEAARRIIDDQDLNLFIEIELVDGGEMALL